MEEGCSDLFAQRVWVNLDFLMINKGLMMVLMVMMIVLMMVLVVMMMLRSVCPEGLGEPGLSDDHHGHDDSPDDGFDGMLAQRVHVNLGFRMIIMVMRAQEDKEHY